MFVLHKSNRKISARTQINIKEVKDNILVLPGNRYRAVMEVSSVNFELKSEEEQDSIIDTYESFLNSIGSRLQILIRTREIDMDKYLGDLTDRLSSETEQIYQTQLCDYKEFIQGLISTNKILTRHFYIIVPYDGTGKMDFQFIQEQVSIHMDIVAKGLGRLGIQSRQLSNLELLDLFYSFYNPKEAKIQPLENRALEILHKAFVENELEMS